MRTIGCLFVLGFVLFTPLSACALNRNVEPIPIFASVDAGSVADASVTCPMAAVPDAAVVTPPVATWPRSHPSSTLLVDHLGDLWMSMPGGMRYQINGDDVLGEVGIDRHDASPMTLEEEHCLTPVDEYWLPNNEWSPVYGPGDDPELFAVDWGAHVRHPVSVEALRSYGYYTSWIDYYDGSSDEWSELTLGDPIGMRDGALVHTQYGFAFIVHDRSFYFTPTDLIAAAGYHAEDAIWMNDSRLRDLAPPSFGLTYDSFDLCPADDAVSP